MWQAAHALALLMVLLSIIGLSPAATPASAQAGIGGISGVVTQTNGTTPISGAQVSFYLALPGFDFFVTSVFTNGAGQFSISGLAVGNYKLRATQSNYIEEYYNNKPSLEQADLVAVTSGATTANIHFTLSRYGSIAGRVFQSNGTTPITDAEVTAVETSLGSSYGVVTDGSGNYLLQNLVPGTYSVQATRFPTHFTEYYNNKPDLAQADSIIVSEGGAVTNINFTLDRKGRIDGTVRATDNVTPIAGAEVGLYDFNSGAFLYSTTTAGNGTYSLYGATGTYRVQALKQGAYVLEFYNEAATLADADPVSVTNAMTTPNVNFTLQSVPVNADLTGTLQLQRMAGQVKPSPAWSVYVYVDLTLSGTGWPLKSFHLTNTSGVFTIADLNPGVYVLRVKGDHTLAVAQTINLAPGENLVTVNELPEGDANQDNVVNILDFSILALSFGYDYGDPPYNSFADFNQDQIVSIYDFSLLAASFGMAGAP